MGRSGSFWGRCRVEEMDGWIVEDGVCKRVVNWPFESHCCLTRSCGEGSGVNGIF